ncbi:MAG: glycosyltransferase [Microcystaceae cyanobacterium]
MLESAFNNHLASAGKQQKMIISQTNMEKKEPRIAIDGIFFQLNNTGIARVWRSLLEEWCKSDFANHIIVLDRDGTAPRVPNVQYHLIEPFDYSKTATDAQMLQSVCDELEIDIFVSTYYTSPINTPSVLVLYDMIPEILQMDLSDPMWQEKRYGILHAFKYISISKNTAKDLIKFFPFIAPEQICIAHCGISANWSPVSLKQIDYFRTKYSINKPYFLLVGRRSESYKNAALFFQALSQWPHSKDIAIVCIGGDSQLEPELANLAQGVDTHVLKLDDSELKSAYSGAVALVYPSIYEGFGLPIAEAMACGCPVITCRNSSIPEVAGDAVLYVGKDNVEEMRIALTQIQEPGLRNKLIESGFKQASQFSWHKMAETIEHYLVEAAAQVKEGTDSPLNYLWKSFRDIQAQDQQTQILYHSSQQQIQAQEKKLESLTTNATGSITNSEQSVTITKEKLVEGCYLHLLDREAQQEEINSWLRSLEHYIHTRDHVSVFDVLHQFLSGEEFQNAQAAKQLKLKSIVGESVGFLGENRPFSPSEILSWYQKVAQEFAIKSLSSSAQPLARRSWQQIFTILQLLSNPKFEVTIITSLYKGKKYIKSFLENIVSQTIFKRCQLLIIDANSPENEYEIIQKFTQKYPNIIYKRLEQTIGIYEVWNLAIAISNTEFITNANVDDALRNDAIEMKVSALKGNPEVDVVYGDVYYSFMANLPFEVVEKGGLKTELPTVNKENLIQFNSPHNAPMWRRSLHDKIGCFDTTYKSAGDYEFWLRALVYGVKFLKIQQPLGVYYNNPHGMSTRQDTPGVIEGERLIKKYKPLLENEQMQPNIEESINHLTKQLQAKQTQLETTHITLSGMKSSKFWQLRSAWFRLKLLLFPLLSLIIGLSLLVISNSSYNYQYLIQVIPWFSELLESAMFRSGINLLSVALVLGIVGYLGYINAKVLRLLRITIISGGLVLITLTGIYQSSWIN